MVKNPPANAGDIRDVGLIPESGRCPWRRAWQPTPVSLPGKSHRQRSLADYHPWGRKESDTTEVTQHRCTHLIKNYLAFKKVGKYIRRGKIRETELERTQITE